ncbi:MAG: glycerol-3-phosphate acyltransferase [Ruminococcaceae bacterium]|nr:glycerol-3-phosphate acyltransferase [Oscillospiraceae bacterium]
MIIFLYIAAALCAYLVTGFNPAIAFSRLIYKKDIRNEGSGNPGFTNFKRTFGNKLAWWVLLIDLSKAAVCIAIFAWLLSRFDVDYTLGAAYTGFFAVIGHCFPVWYGFKGGKGFLVCMSCVWFLDWRAGLIALIVMLVLLFTAKYMSLATVAAMLTCPVTLLIFSHDPGTVLFCGASVLLMAVRHSENFKRLIKGTERKFSLKSKKA